jgi:hypothetical protein
VDHRSAQVRHPAELSRNSCNDGKRNKDGINILGGPPISNVSNVGRIAQRQMMRFCVGTARLAGEQIGVGDQNALADPAQAGGYGATPRGR